MKSIKELLENPAMMSDEDLLETLFIARDTLPRKVVDEFIVRGSMMVESLWDIIANDNHWKNYEGGGWWAVIHATFIIGAIGGDQAIIPLIMSMRFCDAYDCDWVHEALPSIFG